jgi:hypothetical protein
MHYSVGNLAEFAQAVHVTVVLDGPPALPRTQPWWTRMLTLRGVR